MKHRNYFFILAQIFIYSAISVNSSPEKYVVNNYGTIVNKCDDLEEIDVENATITENINARSVNDESMSQKNQNDLLRNLFADGDEEYWKSLVDIFNLTYGYSIEDPQMIVGNTRAENSVRNVKICEDMTEMFSESVNKDKERNFIDDIINNPCVTAAVSFKIWLFHEFFSCAPKSKTMDKKNNWIELLDIIEKMLGQPLDEDLENIPTVTSISPDWQSLICDKIIEKFSGDNQDLKINLFLENHDSCINAKTAFIINMMHNFIPPPENTLENKTDRVRSLFIDRDDKLLDRFDASMNETNMSLDADFRSKADPNSYRIVGGYDVQITDYPFVVSYGYGCGGTILNNYWILTAAHCGSNDKIINVGSTLHLHGKTYGIAKHIIHSNWNDYTLDFDFQLLKLKKPLEFSSTVQPVTFGCTSEILPGEEVTVLGWGKTSEDTGPSITLKAVDVPVVTDEYCKKSMIITENMFCAGVPKGKKDACQGDSGGPVVRNDRLIGVVSFGVGCGRPGYPGVYAKVPMVIDWINEHIN